MSRQTLAATMSWVQPLAVGVAAVGLASLVLNGLIGHSMTELVPFNLSDFLISYRGGFVRRGLIGEILYATPILNSPSRIEAAVKLFSLAWLLFALSFLSLLVFRQTRSLSTALLIATQPFSFGYLVLTYEWLRKDAFLIGIFYLSLFLLREPAVRVTGGALVALNTISMVAALSHEVYGLSLLPVLMLVAAATFHAAGDAWARALVKSVATFTPTILVMVILVLHQGDQVVAQKIADAWRARGIAGPFFQQFQMVIASDDPPILALRHFTRAVASDGWSQVLRLLLYWLVTFVVCAGLLVAGAGLTADIRERRRAFVESAVVVAATSILFLPLFIMAVDWGRWICLWGCATSAVVHSGARQHVAAFLMRPRGLEFSRLGTDQRSTAQAPSRPLISAALVAALFLLPVPMSPVHPCCDFDDVARWSLTYRLAAATHRVMAR